jgi:hypothetical protein
VRRVSKTITFLKARYIHSFDSFVPAIVDQPGSFKSALDCQLRYPLVSKSLTWLFAKDHRLNRDQHLQQRRFAGDPSRTIPSSKQRQAHFAIGVEVRVEAEGSIIGLQIVSWRLGSEVRVLAVIYLTLGES